MKIWSNVILFTLIFSLVLSCGGDPIQKGDEAFKKNELLDAQKYYERALSENPNDNTIKEKLMTTYFRTGENYYVTKKLITAYEGQVKQGFGYLPEPLSDSLKGEISKVLLKLAVAFREIPAENEFQKEEFTDKSIHYLNEALKYDSMNTAVFKNLESIKNEEAKNTIKKGERYLEAGEKDSKNYFTAEKFFLDALKLDPGNQEAAKYLRLTRNKTLTIYNYEQFTPIKIMKKSWIGELLVFEIKILNNTNRAMDLKGDGFYLSAADGSKLSGFFSEKFSMPYITKKLPSGNESSGVVSFEAEKNGRYIRLGYQGGDRFEGYKNLP